MSHGPVPLYPCSQVGVTLDTILGPESEPCQLGRKNAESHEDPAANNVVARRVKLEEEQAPRLQKLRDGPRRRLPEIYFVWRTGAQVVKPVFVGNTDPKLHRALSHRGRLRVIRTGTN